MAKAAYAVSGITLEEAVKNLLVFAKSRRKQRPSCVKSWEENRPAYLQFHFVCAKLFVSFILFCSLQLPDRISAITGSLIFFIGISLFRSTRTASGFHYGNTAQKRCRIKAKVVEYRYGCDRTGKPKAQFFGGSTTEHNDSFKMTYSAQQQKELPSIRQKYVPQIIQLTDELLK